jgi:hypothetical protein
MSLPVELIERARSMAVEHVVAARGIKLRRVGGTEWIGPCPADGGHDRFSINTRKQVFNCRGFGGGDVIAMVEHICGCSFADAVRILAGTIPADPAQDLRTTDASLRAANAEADDGYAGQQARKAAWLWQQRQPLAGSLAERYLREARGYGGPLPATIGFLPPRNGRHPAMISAFALTSEHEPEPEPQYVDAVHLTFLAPDGRKKADVSPNKICVGRPAARPIVLALVNDGLALGISEGIEDGLSVAWALGIGAWAAGAAGFMPALASTVPGYVETVTIFGHRDPAGERGARTLADRLVARGIEVSLEGV